jgi:P-type Cu+ transporter
MSTTLPAGEQPRALVETNQRADLPIAGMTCASCVVRVEDALRKSDGVAEATVNFALQRATVSFDPARTNERALAAAIEDAGYAVPLESEAPRASTVELPILGMTCASCVRRIERAVRAVPGVCDASVNLALARASVTFDRAKTNTSIIAAAVQRAGYQVAASTSAATDGAQGAETAEPETRADVVERAELREQSAIGRDFIVAAVLSVPLLVLAMLHGAIPGSDGPVGRWIQFALATPVVFGPGLRFFRLAWVALRHRTADMNTLVSMGAGAAWLYSTVALVAPGLFPHAEHGVVPHLYFEAAGAILTFVLLGKLLETRARKRLVDAVRGLVALQPRTAHRLRGENEEDVRIEALEVDDLVRVRPGERIPTDGQVIAGTSAVDESMLTGESMPVDKSPGSAVFGGTLNRNGSLTLRTSQVGKGTALARIVEAVEEAQGSKAPIARLADTVSAVFVPVVLGIATLTFVVWVFLDPSATGVGTAIERFVAVLVIACPCALGLATPAAVAVGTGRGAELGVLVKGGAALEAASRIDTVLLDKTGTLTSGKLNLTDVVALERGDEGALLRLVASVESASEHPVARSIVEAALERGVALGTVESFDSRPGQGVEGRVEEKLVQIGTADWMHEIRVSTGPLDADAARIAALGRTPAFVAIDGQLEGLVAVADRPADQAAETIRTLQEMGIDVAMVTGDRLRTAEAVANELGIRRVFAEVKPADKARVVFEERARDRTVAMVGDGINDAPALAGAHVGVAIGHGTDIAIAASDVTLLRGGIAKLVTALRLARATLRTIRQNLFWAFVYNVVGIPVAAGLLYPWTGWLLSPVLASAAMSLSSVSVLANSLRLRRFTGDAPA